MSQLFQCMFTDSEIAKDFQLISTKLTYITNFGIAPYFHQLLIDILKNCNYYSTGNYMFKVNNRNTRTRCEICSKATIKTAERH